MQQSTSPSLRAQLRRRLSERFSLLKDKANDDEIESRIREGVALEGATPWILMFAIFVASIGLNVNSTAVIIGAMLISPLMGPIMGAGLGVAVYDFDLVKRSLLNLAIATVISLVVSALYFLISPLQEAQSELLARTTPTVWDVLIALFGGLAGIVGVTRRERSNVIPGVAIATALMPPVCTAGYGLATGQWAFFGGALFLYAINCVFIGLATAAGIRVLGLRQHGFADAAVERRVKLSIFLLIAATTVPSSYLAVKLVKDEVFKANARHFVAQQFALKDTQVATLNITPGTRTIEVALIGTPLSQTTLQNIEGRLSMSNLDGAKIVVRQSRDNFPDVASLKSSLLLDLYASTQEAMRQKDEEIATLRKQLGAQSALFDKADDVAAELRAQYPAVSRVTISEGLVLTADGQKQRVVQLDAAVPHLVPMAERQRLQAWFKVRTKSDQAIMRFEVVKSGQ
ncbi:TIGR00341 family protein [Aquabacterium sp.]|uniref:TIGR00341 family protein n=1 Tax=Aquabacterium sp. TaxID=1872578 RepID=UPI0035B3A68A